MALFKSKYGRYGTYLGTVKAGNHIQFDNGLYQTDKEDIIKQLKSSQYYGIDFCLESEFPVCFPDYRSKSRTDKGNAEIYSQTLSENEEMKKKIAQLEAQAKSGSTQNSPKPSPKKAK